MTARKKAEPEVEAVEEPVEDEAPTVVVHDYDPVRPHSRRRNVADDVPAWIGEEHPEVDE